MITVPITYALRVFSFYIGNHQSRTPHWTLANSAGNSHKLPPLPHITQPISADNATTVTVPAQRTARSPAAGPTVQAISRYSALPPSKGYTGKRLKAQSTRFAPTSAGQRPFPKMFSARAAKRLTAAPPAPPPTLLHKRAAGCPSPAPLPTR